MQPLRPWAVALAASSAGLPAVVLGFIALRLYLPVFESVPFAIFYAALAVWVVTLLARIALRRRLSPAEEITVRFWAFAPALVLVLATVLSALPLLLLYTFGFQLGPGTARAFAIACVVLSGVVIWVLWLRFRPSLGDSPKSAA